MIKSLWLYSHTRGLWTNGSVSITVGANKDFGDRYLKQFVFADYGVIIHEPLTVPSHREVRDRLQPPINYYRTPEEVVEILNSLCPVHHVSMYYHKPTELYACQNPDCWSAKGVTWEEVMAMRESLKK